MRTLNPMATSAYIHALPWTPCNDPYDGKATHYCLTGPYELVRIVFNPEMIYRSDTEGSLSSPMTSEVRQWLISNLPRWWNWDYASTVAAAQFAPRCSVGRVGRFLISGLKFIAADELSAMAAIARHQVPPKSVKYTPGVTVTEISNQTAVWSDKKRFAEHNVYPLRARRLIR